MGGRARGGEWQVELPPSARDPRDAVRAARVAPDPSSFISAGRTFQDTEEEYPALAPTGTGSLTIGGWGKLSNKSNKKQDFPALSGGLRSGVNNGVGGGGGGGGGRSFSGAAIGSYIRDGKVGGSGSSGISSSSSTSTSASASSVAAVVEESWGITTKKDKRLKSTGGISMLKQAAVGVGVESVTRWDREEEKVPDLKGSDYPSLSMAVRPKK